LINPAKIIIEKELSPKNTPKKNNEGSKDIFVNRKIDSEIAKQMIESQSDFTKLITNYKYNIKEICLNDSDNLSPNHIIYNIDTKVIISYSYGRLLRILSNFQLINKDNKLLDVSLSLGKDFVREFLFEKYKQERGSGDKNNTYFE